MRPCRQTASSWHYIFSTVKRIPTHAAALYFKTQADLLIQTILSAAKRLISVVSRGVKLTTVSANNMN